MNGPPLSFRAPTGTNAALLAKFQALQTLPRAGTIWRSNKNGRQYVVLSSATNCTNEQDGQSMVLYVVLERNIDEELYVRLRSEFLEKFSPVI